MCGRRSDQRCELLFQIESSVRVSAGELLYTAKRAANNAIFFVMMHYGMDALWLCVVDAARLVIISYIIL